MKSASTSFLNPGKVISIAILLLTLSLSGCVHRIGIQQGNFLDKEDIDRVTVGMTRVQVRALLGTPMVADPFHNSRWDYYYYFKLGRWKDPITQHFIVHFNEEDKVERLERLSEARAQAAAAANAATPQAE